MSENQPEVYIVLAVPAGKVKGATFDVILTFRCSGRSYHGLSRMRLIEQYLSHRQARELASWMKLAGIDNVTFQASTIAPHLKTRDELLDYFLARTTETVRVKHVGKKP